MSEIDANIIVEGQKAVATIPQDGEIIEDGGEIDATCIVEDSNGKRHKAVKIVNIDDEPSDKSEIDAQVSNNNNELIMVTEEQDGEIIPQENSEIDFHCLVQKDEGKQLSVKTVELDGEIIKTGGAIDATCLVQGSDGKRYKAVKVFNLGGTSDWKNKPADWSDIRKDCPVNSIALYAGELGSNYIIEDGKLIWANPNIYLQSSGTQYIDSGIYATGNTTFEIKYDATSESGTIFGSRTSSSSSDRFMLFKSDNNRFDYDNAYGMINSFSMAIMKTEILNDSYSATATNLASGTTRNASTSLSVFTTPKTLKIYAGDTNGTISSYVSAKIYYFKIYEEGVLIRHFVPVPENLVIGNFTCPSNGMFDIVNQQFYGNEGTGDFTYSKDSISNDYDNLGFTATCTGGYNVFIDGTQYGTTYASGARCSITWSTSGITTGDIVTTPSLLKAHKIWIEPATEGNNITAFRCARVAVSEREAQGILWAHFNIDNEINLGTAFATYNSYYEPLMLSMTAKNNIIKCNKLPQFGQSSDLAAYAANIEYLPIFDLNNNTINGAAGSFNLLTTAELEKVILKNGTITGSFNSLACNATKLKKINTKNVVLQPTFCQQAFQNNQSIEEIPDIDFTNATNLTNFITNAVALKDTVLDTRAGTGITKIDCYGTSQYFMSGFKGLRVSNQAPFNNATPPQINVSYTGMDRSALVQLFNDLPTVTGGQIINVTGCTGANNLTADDKTIATAKGWTITL